MIPGNRIFIYEHKIGPFDIYRFLFYSKNPRLTITDFKNSLRVTLEKLMQKYKRNSPYDLIRIASFPNDLKREMNRLGFTPIDNFNYLDITQVFNT